MLPADDTTWLLFIFRSNSSSTLLFRDNPGQPGVALRQLRAPGRGATAPAVDRRRRRGKRPPASHRTWAGHSLRGSIIMVQIFSILIQLRISNEVIKRERRTQAPSSPSLPGSVCVVQLSRARLRYIRVFRRCYQLSSSGLFQFSSSPIFGFLSNLINSSSQSHFPASTESLYASYGPRDEEALHRSVTRRSRQWPSGISESPKGMCGL
jgi:hypothetical protein